MKIKYTLFVLIFLILGEIGYSQICVHLPYQESFGYVYEAFLNENDSSYVAWLQTKVSQDSSKKTRISDNLTETPIKDSVSERNTDQKKRDFNVTINPNIDLSKKIEVSPNVNTSVEIGKDVDADKRLDDSFVVAKHQINNIIQISNDISSEENDFFLKYCIESEPCRGKISIRLLVISGLGFILIAVIFIRKLFSCKKKNNEPKEDVSELGKKIELLGPIDDVKNYDKTIEYLKYAVFEKDKIKNIAITGPYGSGKTSVWETFEKKNEDDLKKIRLKKISLAKFNSPKNEKEDDVKSQEIEESIIQQLLYSETEKVLKYSRIFRIKNLSREEVSLKALCVFLVVAVLLLFICPEFMGKICYSISQNNLSYNILFVIATLITGFAVYKGIQYVSKCRISGVCVNDVQIELDQNQSLLNKYLDEIVYFFIATQCKCLLIEDLDRFNSLSIFSKLREINFIVNKHPNIQKKGIVKFVYAVRDDVLKGHEKTKFFDFVIPVIPVVSKDNAKDYMKKYLAQGKDICLGNGYLKNVQDFITDLRMVKNCINEYHIYEHELTEFYFDVLVGKDKENKFLHIKRLDEKIFSLLLYKSLCPLDFKKLCNHEGILYKSLYNLNEMAEELSKDLSNKKLDIRKIDNSISAKDLLKNDGGNYRNLIRKYIEKIKIEQKDTDANADLIIILLSNGYVDDSYGMIINKSYDAFFTNDERSFLLNVKNDIPNSLNLVLVHYEELKEEIKDSQWNSVGVLNLGMIDYLLDIYEGKVVRDSVIPRVILAMETFFYSNNENFLDECLAKYPRTSAKRDLLLESICVAIKKKEIKDRQKFISFVFNRNDVELFEDFLTDSNLNYYGVNADITGFIDSNTSFKNMLFVQNKESLEELDSILDFAEIKVRLTNEMVEILNEKRYFDADFYFLTKENVDLILRNNSHSIEEDHYLSRCLLVEGLNQKLKREIVDFCDATLIKFVRINESYEGVELIFSAKMNDDSKKFLFDKMSNNWTSCILYNKYLSFNEKLDSRFIQYLLTGEWNEEEIDDILKKHQKDVEFFISTMMACSSIDETSIERKFIPIWRGLSVLKCFDWNVERIKSMNPERVKFVMRYAVANERENLGCVPLLYMIIQEPEYFESVYPKDEWAKDSVLKRLVLGKKENRLINVKRHFLKMTPMYPFDDVNGKKIYKEAALECSPVSLIDDLSIMIDYLGKMRRNVIVLEDLNLYQFRKEDVGEMINISDILDFDKSEFNNYWIKMLWNVLKYRLHQMCMFLALNTFSYPGGMQGLKEMDRMDEKKVDKLNKTFRSLYRQFIDCLDEIENYVNEYPGAKDTMKSE